MHEAITPLLHNTSSGRVTQVQCELTLWIFISFFLNNQATHVFNDKLPAFQFFGTKNSILTPQKKKKIATYQYAAGTGIA
jgi:hypothetical protein